MKFPVRVRSNIEYAKQIPLKRKIITTADGSKTIQLPDWNEQYHSVHGAVQESYHVFIANGLAHIQSDSISILEIGFGTGLNALITYLEAKKSKTDIQYTGVEAFPVMEEEWGELDYAYRLRARALDKGAHPDGNSLVDDATALLGNPSPSNKDSVAFYEALESLDDIFIRMHEIPWEAPAAISEDFILQKQQKDFFKIEDESLYDLVYFDAFGARVQPELWTEGLFRKMYLAMKKDGILTTYSAKGSVRRAMQAVGFTVERLPGPPGKREMLRAHKT